jgi:hypothetical protein
MTDVHFARDFHPNDISQRIFHPEMALFLHARPVGPLPELNLK